MPVQRAVERDEIPYPCVAVRGRAAVACKHCNCGDAKFFLIKYRKKKKDKRTGCINIQKHNYVANYISRIY